MPQPRFWPRKISLKPAGQSADAIVSMKKFVFIVGAIALVAGSFWLVKAFTTLRANARHAKFKEDIENLFVGLQQYKEQVGQYPAGMGNADIAKALKGQNARNVIILVGRKNDLSPKGEYVDPWGTPLRFYFADSGVLIRSAGPNRRFDDSTVMESDDFFRSN